MYLDLVIILFSVKVTVLHQFFRTSYHSAAPVCFEFIPLTGHVLQCMLIVMVIILGLNKMKSSCIWSICNKWRVNKIGSSPVQRIYKRQVETFLDLGYVTWVTTLLREKLCPACVSIAADAVLYIAWSPHVLYVNAQLALLLPASPVFTPISI